jgi:hypothetical protein
VDTSVASTTASLPEGIHHIFYISNNSAWKKKYAHHIRRDSLKNRFDHYLSTRLREAFATPRVDFLPDHILDIGENIRAISPDNSSNRILET